MNNNRTAFRLAHFLLCGALVAGLTRLACASDTGQLISTVILRPGPKPPPLGPTFPTPTDELFSLNSSYRMDSDPKGALAQFNQLAEQVTAIQARVFATNLFLAGLHNYTTKLKLWSQPYLEERGKLGDWRQAHAGTPAADTNNACFDRLNALMAPVLCLELMDDPGFSELITEAVRIELDPHPPVPALPPCIYMTDWLLDLPTATNMSLRLPAVPPPTAETIRRELQMRATLALQKIRNMEFADDFPTSAIPANKAFLEYGYLTYVIALCKQVDLPADLSQKLRDARAIRSRLPRALTTPKN